MHVVIKLLPVVINFSLLHALCRFFLKIYDKMTLFTNGNASFSLLQCRNLKHNKRFPADLTGSSEWFAFAV